ncbi:MFS general substrate transporter [Plenodomus tracheiphilus IPT5]|uniref:MFS general substrate transporter n=1 Tax=Plenodomus tracheiphilus IPT5 TaxID=1408161 RepID=A0A6A7ASE7_9PLEO|nr:MFS general substrate transporter [Plenodomus tracheiphilus IPT5]
MTSTHSTEQTPLLTQPEHAPTADIFSAPSYNVSNESPTVQQQHSGLFKTSDEEETLAIPSTSPTPSPPIFVGRIVSVLLIGTFIANADSSLLIATHPIIASEFNALRDSSWLLTSFALAQAATLPLYGKLSDIFGRKTMLILAYGLFALGCGLVGIGTSMSTLIVGRVISGAGASGMTTLVSILITDLVSLRDVATWRSYVNVVATTGRSIGGPVGGWLSDTVGWRWSFLGQVPLAILAIVLVGTIVPARSQHDTTETSQKSKLARVDFIGALMLTMTILGLLFPLEIGGDRVTWTSPTIGLLLAGAVCFGGLFIATEGWLANEPIVPLSLLQNRNVVVSALVMVLQGAAQIGLMFAIPLYFQITASASNTVAGAHLVPAVVGNAIGGIISGAIIKRTGRYKALILTATIVSSSAYLLLILRWHGDTNWLESLYIFPGGFGMGVVQSALFISVQAGIDPTQTAVAASALYLASAIGALSGMAGVSAVLQSTLRLGLDRRLSNLGFTGHMKRKIIEHAVSDVHYVDKAKSNIAKAVIGSYIEALTWTHVLSLTCSVIAFTWSLFLRQHKLR